MGRAWLYFCFDFIRSDARCGCCPIVRECAGGGGEGGDQGSEKNLDVDGQGVGDLEN